MHWTAQKCRVDTFHSRVFSLDPQHFPLDKMRSFVQRLHDNGQHFIMMVDPAVAYADYPPFIEGRASGSFMLNSSGQVYQGEHRYFEPCRILTRAGVVWPGVAAYPDWFGPNTQTYWNNQFARCFSPESGVDIDALWIDMNEASNFCTFPCDDPATFAKTNENPALPQAVRDSATDNIPGSPGESKPSRSNSVFRLTKHQGLPGRDLINPRYQIHNAAGSISNKTIRTDLIHANGLTEYDTHNLYGHMMSLASYNAMLNRRPDVRPLVFTRSTFAGAGNKVGHWLGDNDATWDDYRISIAQAISFASIYQITMVGADVCGYGDENTTSTLCARWAMLGAFIPFYRSHQCLNTVYHEFYRWPLVTEAAKVAIKARYQLLDYLYTSFWSQAQTGIPSVTIPYWFVYPEDPQTLSISAQFFFGPNILVSPVTEEDATSVSIYLTRDTFYDFWTYKPVHGKGETIDLTDVGFTQIPVHIRSGSIIPMRVDWANTTTMLRKLPFKLVIAPSATDGNATGTLYLDDGKSIIQQATSVINFTYTGSKSTLKMAGTFEYDPGATVNLNEVVLLGVKEAPGLKRLADDALAGEKVMYVTNLDDIPGSFHYDSGAFLQMPELFDTNEQPDTQVSAVRVSVKGVYNATSQSMAYTLNRSLTEAFEVVLCY